MEPIKQKLILAISILKKEMGRLIEIRSNLKLSIKSDMALRRNITIDIDDIRDNLESLLSINLEKPITKKMNKKINDILFIYGFT